MAKINLTALKQVVQSGLSHLWVKALPGDNVYVTGGVALSLANGAIADPSAIGVVGPNSVPKVLPNVFSQSMTGYTATIIPATGTGAAGLSTYKLMYRDNTGTEIAAGAYPAAITGGVLNLLIVY